MKARNLVLAVFVFGLIGSVWWIWLANPSIATGRTIATGGYPYQHLTYNKLSPDHGGNFTGDVYMLAVATGERIQLTKGGTTGKARWVNNQEMLVAYRPKGSVVDPYYLDVTTGRLSVADRRVDSFLFYKERFESSFSPSRSYYTVHIPNTESALADRYAILKSTRDGAEIIATISSAVFTPPAWIPNSEMLVYGRSDEQICLLHLVTLEEVCRPGSQPVVTNSGQPILVAYFEITGSRYEVCTAEISDLSFSRGECHDENQRQITDLAWRP